MSDVKSCIKECAKPDKKFADGLETGYAVFRIGVILRQARGNAGFTLLEVLVVLLMIGIILGFATLSVDLGGRERLLEQEAKRLQALLSVAQEEAILENRSLGLRLEADGYQFYQLDEAERWQVVEADDSLRPRQLPALMRLSVEIDGLAVKTGDEEAVMPQIALLSSGELTPFRCVFQFSDEARSYQLEGTASGQLRLIYPSEAP